jgi:competence protein ComEC
LDVGPGAAVHLRPRGADWLFDCGSDRNYQRAVRPYLHWAGVNRLDSLLLTHGDSLHIGGAAELLRDFHRVRLMDNPAPDRSIIHQQLQRLLQQQGIKTDHLAAGESFRLSREVTAHVLFPPRVFLANMSDDQTYVIQLVVAPSTSILFMSDSGQETENALLAYGLNLRSDIIIKGQHHSGQSGSDPFLDAVRPQLIIATSRDFPEYERISDEWAEHVRARGIKLFRQDETGAVTVRVGRDGWEAQSYLTGECFRSSSR